MRFVCSFAAATVAFTVTTAVLACGGQVTRAVERPQLVVQPPESPQLARAQLLDETASQKQMQATRAEQRAATLLAHAQQLRLMANEIDGVEATNLELAAGQLALRAKQTARRAQLLHGQARDLRARARQLRMQTTTVHRMGRPKMRATPIRRPRFQI